MINHRVFLHQDGLVFRTILAAYPRENIISFRILEQEDDLSKMCALYEIEKQMSEYYDDYVISPEYNDEKTVGELIKALFSELELNINDAGVGLFRAYIGDEEIFTEDGLRNIRQKVYDFVEKMKSKE